MSLLKERTNIRYVKTLPEMRSCIEEIRQKLSQLEKPRVALDVETGWLDGAHHEDDEVPRPIFNNGRIEGFIRTVQIGLPPELEDYQYVFDVKEIEDTIVERRGVGSLLKPIIEGMPIYGQNLQYEFMWMWGIYKIRIPAQNIRDVRYIRAVVTAGDKSARSNLGALYDDYLSPHFFKEYTGVFQGEYKDHKVRMQKSNWKAETLSTEQITYAADDVSRLIFELYDAMLEGHDTRSVDAFIGKHEGRNKFGQTVTNVIKLEWKVIPVFAMMEYRGMQYDIAYHNREIIPALEAELAKNQAIVDKHMSKKVMVKKNNGLRGKARVTWTEEEFQPINIGSWQQLLPALKSIGVDVPDTQKETLMLAGEEYDHEALHAVIAYREAASMMSKYGKMMPKYIKSTGRVHASWNQLGGDQAIATGRSTATDPALLTIKNDFRYRRPFTARSADYVLIDSDYSQAEPRTIAALCKDKVLLDIYNAEEIEGVESISRHSFTAKFMFDLDYFPKDDDPYYKAGKTYNLGSTYGMGIKKGCYRIKIATRGAVDLSEDELKLRRDKLYGQLKGMKYMQDKINKDVRAGASQSLKKYLSGEPIVVMFTPYGRPRSWFLNQLIKKEDLDAARKDPEILDKDYGPPEERWKNIYNSVFSKIGRDAFNFVCGQGAQADFFKLALVYLQEALDENGFDFETEGIILCMHDEILLEVKKENKDLAKELLESCMLRAAYDIIQGVKYVVECKIGDNWAEAH